MPLNNSLKIDYNTPMPLYYQIKQIILTNINNKSLIEGECLPTELSLQKAFNVSRATIRQAMNDLVNSGHLYRVKGKGTFVAQPKIQENFFQQLESFNDEMNMKGLVPKTKVIEFKIVDGINEINSKLGLKDSEKLIYLSRVRYANESPVVYLETYIPYERYEKIIEQDMEVKSLYSLLEGMYNHRVNRAVRNIEAVIATNDEAKYLQIKPGAPLLLVKSNTFTHNNLPVEYSIARYRGNNNKFIVELTR